MPDPVEAPISAPESRRAEFFRHSGWLMVAAILGGAFAWGVHFLAQKMPPADYGLFGALMAVTMCVPAMPLQMVFTHQAASAVASGRDRQLAGLVRVFSGGCFLLWLVVSMALLLFQKEIFYRWEVTDPAAFWVMLPFLLLTMLMPVFSGILQGQQNFPWFGWASLISLAVRFGVALLAVLIFRAGAAGLMAGVLVGSVIGFALALWQTAPVWRNRSEPSNWKAVLREALPLLMGFGAFQFLFSADVMFAKAYFGATDVGSYNGAGTLSRALMWVVGPLAVVMFPKIVHSHARSEKSDLVGIVVLGTAILAGAGALGLAVVGPWIVPFVFGQSYTKAASLLPWYAGAMVPLTLANALLNNLLARAQFRIVPALFGVAAVYVFAMTQMHATMVQLLQAFGISNCVLLAVCAFFTWQQDSPKPEPLTGTNPSPTA